jgi:hypothetical protein
MMKSFFATLLLVLAVALAAGCTKAEETAVLNVNDIGSDPAAYVGAITITGVTAGFAQQDQTVFGIMDKKELQCQSPNCNKVILPVRFQGAQPALGDEVQVTGAFVNDGRGYVFAASAVKVLKNHKLGG